MFRSNDSLKYGVNELMKSVLDPAFEWTELKIKHDAVIEDTRDDTEADHSPNAIPSGPLDADAYPVVPETLLQYCAPPRFNIFGLYGKSRMNFNISTLCMLYIICCLV